MNYLVILIVVVLVLLGAGALILFLVFNKIKSKGRIDRALNMSLFLVSMPSYLGENKQGVAPKSEKELISVMEQLISSFSGLKGHGWWKTLVYGSPYIVFEMAVHHIGEEIHFYVSVPRSYEQILQKQINGLYSDAQVERVDDYNIFNPGGVTIGTSFRLEKNGLLPFRTYQSLETDPIGNVLTAFSKISEAGEGAAIQILIKPSEGDGLKSLAKDVSKEMRKGYDFEKALQRAKNPPAKPKTDEDKQKLREQESSMASTPLDDEINKAIQGKISKQTFDTNIRAIVSAPNEVQAEQLINEIESAFVQYESPYLNLLKFKRTDPSKIKDFAFNYSFRLFDENQKSWLSTEEISSLYHFPIATTQAPGIKSLRGRSAEPPANLPKEGVLLGHNNFRGEDTPVYMTPEDRRRHMYVIGQTGTGKTTVMKAMLRQDIENGKGVCVIDPHGDFADFALAVIPKERADDVIYFNPGDTARPLGLNVLEINPDFPEQKTFVINELLSIIDKIYNLKASGAGGPMFEKYFKNSLLLLLDDYKNKIPTLADVTRVLVDDEFRADKLSRETNVLVKEFWQKEAEKAGGEASLANMAPYISSKVDTFVSNEFLRPIINQQKSAFNFRDVMDNKKILIVNLSKGRIGDINANLLGMIVVGKILMAALSRVDIEDENKRNDFYLYIDEFQNFTTDSISTILSEARKYRLNLTMAHQFIKQLREDIRDSVFGNVGSIISFRISPDDAEFMKNKFEPVFTPQDLMGIDNQNAYASLLIDGKTTRPFNFKVATDLVFDQGSPEMAGKIKELSSLKFGRPREEIEKELMARFESPKTI